MSSPPFVPVDDIRYGAALAHWQRESSKAKTRWDMVQEHYGPSHTKKELKDHLPLYSKRLYDRVSSLAVCMILSYADASLLFTSHQQNIRAMLGVPAEAMATMQAWTSRGIIALEDGTSGCPVATVSFCGIRTTLPCRCPVDRRRDGTAAIAPATLPSQSC